VQMSETHVNSARGSLLLVQKAEVFCVKPPTWALARRVSPGRGPYRASFSPLLFILSLFLFLPGLEKL
jgi:hypothetical protein